MTTTKQVAELLGGPEWGLESAIRYAAGDAKARGGPSYVWWDAKIGWWMNTEGCPPRTVGHFKVWPGRRSEVRPRR